MIRRVCDFCGKVMDEDKNDVFHTLILTLDYKRLLSCRGCFECVDKLRSSDKEEIALTAPGREIFNALRTFLEEIDRIKKER